MKAPFPYFGGKSRVASIVWEALGQPAHYMEPFFGSGAVLLARPNYDPDEHTETVCDADGFVANVWRAIQFDPEGTAKWCDWPVNHADLIARKAALIRNENYLLENLCRDEKWFDTELAGYWIWAASCWIGHGLTRPKQIPEISCAGKGIHAVHHKGMGVNVVGKRPQLVKEKGIHVKSMRPICGSRGEDVHKTTNNDIYGWFGELSNRLRYVRVVCGDWTMICGGNWQTSNWKNCGVFFDPPYGVKDRSTVYSQDSRTIAEAVRKKCIEWGDRPNMYIVLAGYYEEHNELLEHGWTMKRWKTQGGYGNKGIKDSQGKINRNRETLWFSPYCQKRLLFG